MLELQANTAYTLKIGPFIDETDGSTAETGLTITQAEVRLSKNGGDIAQKNEATSCTHDELGVYGCPIDTTDTNTEGVLQLWVHESGALPVFHEYMVLAQAAYISKYTAKDTGYMDVDAKAVSTSTAAADAVEANIGNLDAAVTAVIADTEDLQTQVGTAGDGLTTITDAITAHDSAIDTQLIAITTDTEDLQTQIGTAGVGLSDLKGMNASMKAEVQTEVAAALVAKGLDHLVAASVTGTDITDNSIIAKLTSKESTADWDDYVNTTDSLQALADALAAGVDLVYTPDSNSTIATGDEIAGTYASCSADDGTRWQVDDSGAGDGLDVICEFNLATTRKATAVHINGYFNSAGSIVEIYAYNYDGAAWEKLSAGTIHTEMRTRSSDKDYIFALGARHTDPITAQGEVKIRFLTTAMNEDDSLYLDYVGITAASTGAVAPDVIADAVWNFNVEDVRHLTAGEYTAGHVIKRLVALGTDVATEGTTTSFTLTDGIATNDAYNGMLIDVRDESSSTRDVEIRRITDWTSGLVVTVDRAFSFTPTVGDHVHITCGYLETMRGTDSAATEAKQDTIDGIVDNILADTVEIQGTGFSTATDALVHIHDDHVTYISAAYGSAQKALIDALPSGIAKGVELANLTFPMILSSDHETYATGKTLTEEISKDGGNYAACTNSASEIQSSGTYKITLTAAEMNANIVAVRFTETDCDTTGITIITT